MWMKWARNHAIFGGPRGHATETLNKTVTDRFGSGVLIQRFRLHKERNIQKCFPKKCHRLLSMELWQPER
jgi:hypothetical protein